MPNDEIVTQLEAALALKGVPETARRRGQALYENLARPVRVALIGPEGGGKSALANLFLGTRLLPEGTSARIIEIVPGDTFMAEAVYDDGRLEAPEMEELDSIDGADRLHIAFPSDILSRIALVEAPVNDPDALAEVAASADIILWCSPVFGQSEREVWANLSSDYRDHAFLILTKADKLARKGKLADTIAGLQDVAKSEFAGFYPVATLQGLKSFDSKPKDKTLWTGSGAKALVKAVLDHAAKGRQADLDQAELFLARYNYEIEEVEGVGDRPRSRIRSRQRSQIMRRRSRMTRQRPQEDSLQASTPADQPEVQTEHRAEQPLADTEQPTPKPQLEAAPTPEPAEVSSRVSTRTLTEPVAQAQGDEDEQAPAPAEAADIAETEPVELQSVVRTQTRAATRPLTDAAEVTEAALPAPTATQPDATSASSLADRLGAVRSNPSRPRTVRDDFPARALKKLSATGERLRAVADEPQKVLSLCVDTTDALQSMLEDAPIPAEIVKLSDDLAQSSEMMTLLQLENAPGPAADAVTILLQLKREFEQRLAA